MVQIALGRRQKASLPRQAAAGNDAFTAAIAPHVPLLLRLHLDASGLRLCLLVALPARMQHHQEAFPERQRLTSIHGRHASGAAPPARPGRSLT